MDETPAVLEEEISKTDGLNSNGQPKSKHNLIIELFFVSSFL